MPELYLLDLYHQYKDNQKKTITGILNGYLSSCATKGGSEMRAWWWYWDPQPSDFDILVYMLPTKFDSLILRRDGKFPGEKSDGSDPDNPEGLTVYGGGKGAISEVYTRLQPDVVTANIIFHEVMHMKQMLGKFMHGQNGVASEVVPSTAGLTAKNIEVMRAALRKPVKQYPEGIEVIRNAQARDILVPI